MSRFSYFAAALTVMVASSAAFGAAPRGDSFYREVRELTSQKKYLRAEQKVVQALEESSNPEERSQLENLRALIQSQSGQSAAAEEAWTKLIDAGTPLDDYAHYHRGLARENLNKFDLAQKDYERVLELGPNFRLRVDTLGRLGTLHLQAGRAREAKVNFQRLEKRARSTPSHPEAILLLARAERRLGNQHAFCRQVMRLYKRHPSYPGVWHWGPDLQEQEFDDRKTGCRSNLDDFRQRLRAWLWAGEEERARQEVQEVATRIAAESRDLADELRGSFLVLTGDVDEAYEVVKKIFPQRKHDFDFLQRFSTAAARTGDLASAIGASHAASKMRSGTAAGRKALFQAAFWSYQFQDYDGAHRKFQDFLKRYPKSGLSSDARWYLAWMRYLRRDFPGAIREFGELLQAKNLGTQSRERARYWLAMSHARLGENRRARPLLEEIASDPLKSYYSFAAQARLKALDALEEAPPRRVLPEAPLRLTGRPFLMPGPEPESHEAVLSDEALESEESLAKESSPVPESVIEDNEGEAVSEALAPEIEAPEPRGRELLSSRRFERALLLEKLGAFDDAKWELYELEQKLRGREDLKRLMEQYASLGHYHRSSAMAELRFSNVRAAGGEEGRRFWEMAYPKAFEKELNRVAGDQKVPPEFLWGLMRAESQYRFDAVSPVGALGLMQVMPGTGRRLAEIAGERNFRVDRLLEPPTAIRLGAVYLRRLSEGFEGSWPLVAAAYNAGPHRVHSWLRSFGNLDYDEFIEHIPFLETRGYAKKVMRNSMIYEDLYGIPERLVDLSASITVKGRAELSKKEIWETP